MSKINKLPDYQKMAKHLIRDAVRYASVTGLNFFQDSFHNQGFTDEYFEEWPKRSNDLDPERKVLIKTAFLLNSLRVASADKDQIVFESDAEYAAIHNNGGTIKIRITERSRRYFWFMFKQTGNTMWKALAMTKKSSIIVKMPKRQFIGESATLMRNIDQWLKKEINKRFKQL